MTEARHISPKCKQPTNPNEDDMLSQLRQANADRQREWDPTDAITLTYRGNELAGEVGEACNVIKKIERERLGLRGSRVTAEQLAEELADVIICADLIAMDMGINLTEAVARKFNATSDKYGLLTKFSNVPIEPEYGDS
jgi:NTP pyrophosphatase (non-canonical NTP hydrolase)